MLRYKTGFAAVCLLHSPAPPQHVVGERERVEGPARLHWVVVGRVLHLTGDETDEMPLTQCAVTPTQPTLT